MDIAENVRAVREAIAAVSGGRTVTLVAATKMNDAMRIRAAIAAGVDARDGFVAIHGWRTVTDLNAYDFVRSMPGRGVDTVIYTDITRDGVLSGPNLPAYEQLTHVPGLNIVASGGVSSLKDVERLKALNVYGAIIGKAYYTGAIDLKKAIEVAK